MVVFKKYRNNRIERKPCRIRSYFLKHSLRTMLDHCEYRSRHFRDRLYAKLIGCVADTYRRTVGKHHTQTKQSGVNISQVGNVIGIGTSGKIFGGIIGILGSFPYLRLTYCLIHIISTKNKPAGHAVMLPKPTGHYHQ